MAGPPFARYHHYGPDRVDVEVGAPIAFVTAGLQPISGEPDGIIGASSLPGGLAAVTIHSGPYDTLSQTYDALAAWIAAEGHTAGDGPWEIYLSDPGHGSRSRRTRDRDRLADRSGERHVTVATAEERP